MVWMLMIEHLKMTSSASRFTYWTLLGLSPGSNPKQLKEAFKREAKLWHPDLNRNSRNAEERFKWINEAYLVLSDPKKRFEWEIAGRPGFEIKGIDQIVPANSSEQSGNKSDNGNNFNPTEKLLISFIALIMIFSLNALMF